MSDQKGNDDNAGDKPRDEAPGQGTGKKSAGNKAGDQSARPKASSGASDRQTQTGATAQKKPSGAAKPATASPGTRGSGNGKPPSGGTGRSLLTIFALLVALVALVVAGWLWYRGQQRLAAFNERIDTVEVALESNVQDVVLPRLAQLQGRVESLSGTHAAQQQTLAEIQDKLEETRLQLSGLSQRLEGGVRRWQLMQIEDLLLTANRRLQLYGDPGDARAALKLANAAVARLNDPRLFEVRSRIVDEIAALNALPDPDIEGLALALTALIEQVPTLPLASDVPDEYQPESAQGQGQGQTADTRIDLSSGWRHFVDSVGEALQSMVTIRRADGTQRALLPPEQVYFLTQNLILELQSARLALLEGNSEVYRASLSAAVDWLQQYYATGDPAVAAMIDRLRQMQNIKLDWQAPDISGSLTALRSYMQARSQNDQDARGQSETANAPDESASAGADKDSNGSATVPASGQGNE